MTNYDNLSKVFFVFLSYMSTLTTESSPLFRGHNLMLTFCYSAPIDTQITLLFSTHALCSPPNGVCRAAKQDPDVFILALIYCALHILHLFLLQYVCYSTHASFCLPFPKAWSDPPSSPSVSVPLVSDFFVPRSLFPAKVEAIMKPSSFE